jgi:hypothetical protein
MSVGISRPPGRRTAQDHPRGHANIVCVADLPVQEVYASGNRTHRCLLAAEIHRGAGPDWGSPMVSHSTARVVITFMYTLLILVSVFAMQGMPTNHARTARNLRRSLRSAVADARLIRAEGLDSESPAEVATSLADAGWTSAQP